MTGVAVLGVAAERWLVLAVASFAGGAFGAALGALPSFVFTGFVVVAGESVSVLKAELVGQGVATADALTVGITGSVGFGPVFGPHVAFGGGAAAAAYAARAGYMDTGFDYHEAKNVAHALGTRPDVLAVGGAFGVFGMAVRQVSAGVGAPWDPVAAGVVLSAIAHRLAFGYGLVGTVRADGLFDMSPFEREEMRGTAEGGEVVVDGGRATDAAVRDADRLVVEPWHPHQYEWPGVAMLGLVVGVLGAYVAAAAGSVFLGFGLSAASLVFLTCGVEKVPVTHHITLPAATAAVAFAGGVDEMAMLSSLLVGAVFGLSGALTGEVAQRVFYAHADTHLDPPAAAIVVNTFFVALLAYVGVFETAAWVPTFW